MRKTSGGRLSKAGEDLSSYKSIQVSKNFLINASSKFNG